MVALTIPTWAPAIWKPRCLQLQRVSGVINPDACARAEKDYTWRASRAKSKCVLGTEDDGKPELALQKTNPQQRVDPTAATAATTAATSCSTRPP